MNPKFVRNFLIVRSLSDWLNYIKIYPDIFCIQILLYGVYPVAWNLSGHFLYSDFFVCTNSGHKKIPESNFYHFLGQKANKFSPPRDFWQYPDIFDNIFRTLFFHRVSDVKLRRSISPQLVIGFLWFWACWNRLIKKNPNLIVKNY